MRAGGDAGAADVAPTIRRLQAEGATSLRAIAAGLNAQGIPTARGGGTWSALNRTILTRQTCLCGVLRSRASAQTAAVGRSNSNGNSGSHGPDSACIQLAGVPFPDSNVRRNPRGDVKKF